MQFELPCFPFQVALVQCPQTQGKKETYMSKSGNAAQDRGP